MLISGQHLVPALLLAIAAPIVAYQHHSDVPLVKNLPAGRNVLWMDPGNVAGRDLLNGAGGQAGKPHPPFQFLKEDLSGTNPKVTIRDAHGKTWSVKFGDEAKPSVFSTHLVWACGYVVETEYLITHGRIMGAKHLKRAGRSIGEDGSFTDARFQLRSKEPKYLDTFNWAWNSNPFAGTPELNGLKILVMLLSNWDTKDARDRDASSHDVLADSNLGIFEQGHSTHPTYLFFISDWGASLGKWGSIPGSRAKWNCRDYANQTPAFVKGIHDGTVAWGWTGKHSDDLTQGIRVSDVRWLLQYLGRITDWQLRRGLAGVGASPEEVECYTSAIRGRIGELRQVAR